MRATIAIAVVIIGVFAVQMIVPSITNDFALVSSQASAEPWTFVTSMFLHGDVLHIGYNLIALFIFGLILESVIGSRRLLAVFFGTGILAGFVSIFFYNAVIGASGAIFGIIGTLAVLRPTPARDTSSSMVRGISTPNFLTTSSAIHWMCFAF